MAMTRRKYCTKCHRPLVHIDEHRKRRCQQCATVPPIPWKRDR